jgi:L,D-transpeptidase-like protein/New glue family protein
MFARRSLLLAVPAAALAVFAAPAAAATTAPATATAAQPTTSTSTTAPAPAPATTATTTAPATTTTTTQPAARPKLFLNVAGKGTLPVGKQLAAKGRIRPYVPGQRVELRIGRKGHVIRKRTVTVKPVAHTDLGRFRIRSGDLVAPGPYRVTAVHHATAQQAGARVVSKPVSLHYPDLDPGQSSDSVKIFTRLLARRGYYTPRTRGYGAAVGSAVLAYRKVNGMARTSNATPGMFRTLAKGGGGFKLRYPDAGYHVEVDISRQVMVIADKARARYIIAASTGAPATPTITGHYAVYSKTPGYNSEGMYYSSYWHGGYAIHGYASVPTYNASHGCVRIPIPDARFVYARLPIGTDVYVYH